MSQPLPLRDQLRALEQLQEIDLKIDTLKRNKSSLPAALRTLDDNLNRTRAAVETKKKAIEELEKVQRQTAAAIELNNDRVARASSKLEAVQNTNEYQAATKEMDQLRKLAASLEEQTKKSAADIEAAKKELGELTAQMEKVQQERDTQANVVSGQGAQLDKDITGLTSERAQFTGKVEQRLLSQYDRVRMARGGLGIVPAVAGRCKGCNMVVPPQLYNEIQRGSALHSCPSCHRILFVASQTVEPKAPEATK